MNTVIIGVGSNIEPETHIPLARTALASDHTLVSESGFRVTKPIGFDDQDDFTNGAFLIRTELDMTALEAYLKELETRLGRVRSENRNGPRTIDLDIVTWNGEIVDGDVHTREFLREAVEELLLER